MSSATIEAASRSISEWLRAQSDLDRLDCELLLGHRLGWSRARILSHPEQTLPPALDAALGADLARLRDGIPLAYLTGVRGFWNQTLRVNADVLIPRPETETLVEQALLIIQPGDRVLDLGTGSGAIAIAIASSTAAAVTAVDSSDSALAIAADNARASGVEVEFRHSNWFDNVSGGFDLIVANPPYIAAGDPHLPALRHEPQGALVSGPDGLDDLRLIIAAAPDHLSANGWLLVEHGFDQAEPVAGLFAAAGFERPTLTRDLGGQPRVTQGRWPGRKSS